MSDVLPLVVEWKEKGNSKLKAEDGDTAALGRRGPKSDEQTP